MKSYPTMAASLVTACRRCPPDVNGGHRPASHPVLRRAAEADQPTTFATYYGFVGDAFTDYAFTRGWNAALAAAEVAVRAAARPRLRRHREMILSLMVTKIGELRR